MITFKLSALVEPAVTGFLAALHFDAFYLETAVLFAYVLDFVLLPAPFYIRNCDFFGILTILGYFVAV